MKLFETILEGGILWSRHNPKSPGHSIAIARGTNFKIRLDGTQSQRYEGGVVDANEFLMRDGQHAESRFPSANAAVAAVRKDNAVASNAFLYILFQIEGRWYEADKIRQLERFRVDEVELLALSLATTHLREELQKQKILPDEIKLLRKSAELAPQFIESARIRNSVKKHLSDDILRSLNF